MKRYRNKLTPAHKEFVNRYCRSSRNPSGVYQRVIFCEDENIAIVIPARYYMIYKEENPNAKDYPSAWGCVNMAHQLLVPFEFEMVYDFGHYLIGKYCYGHKVVYNKRGQELYELSFVKRTNHKAYIKLYDYEDDYKFRIAIRKMAISKGLFIDVFIHENGLAYLEKEDGKVGVILFSKLKLPFEYYAIASPQNSYTLAIKESDGSNEDEPTYDCLLIKVRGQIKKEDSVHPTGIKLFSNKSEEEMINYFNDRETFEKECNSIVCYNERVNMSYDKLEFFPFDRGLPNLQHPIEEEDEREEYNEWSRENYSYEEAMYDALGGEMDAIWNLD